MFNHSGEYICECGKIFTNSQSFNGHKSHCKIHYQVTGKDFSIREQLQKNFILKGNQANKIRFENNKRLKEKFTPYYCQVCGKLATTKYGSGIFCSKSCSSKRKKSYTSKLKTSISLIKINNPNISDEQAKNLAELHIKNKSNTKKQIYTGPELPVIELDKTKNQPKYPPRNRIPYSERFWKMVLDNNNVSYQQNVSVWKPGNNNYWLDFLINDNIDLEIDGSMHLKEEVHEKDLIRTQWLESKGYIIYRIKWINPNSEANKILVNQQIEDLLKFLNIERIY